MKKTTLKMTSLALALLLAAALIAGLAAASSSPALASGGPQKGRPQVAGELPSLLKHKVAWNEMGVGPVNTGDSILFKHEDIERQVDWGTHIAKPAGESWKYKYFGESEFKLLDTSVNNFQKPGIYRLDSIEVTQQGSDDGVVLPTDGTAFEYILAFNLSNCLSNAPVEGSEPVFNDKSQPFDLTAFDTVEYEGVMQKAVLGEDVEILPIEGSPEAASSWEFTDANNLASNVVMDPAVNNFVRAGLYEARYALVEGCDKFTIEGRVGTYKHFIAKYDVNDDINITAEDVQYADAVKGIKLIDSEAMPIDSQVKGKWAPDSQADKDILVDDSFAVDASGFSTASYIYSFTPDAGYENDYAYENVSLKVKVNATPLVRFSNYKGEITDVDAAKVEYVAPTADAGAKYKFNIIEAGADRAGYAFKAWTCDSFPGTEYVPDATAKAELDAKARYFFEQVWTPNSNTIFKLKFKLQNKAQDSYVESAAPGTGQSELEDKGTTDTTMTQEKLDEYLADEAYRILGFDLDLDATKADEDNKNFKISGDGTAIYWLFYTRKSFTVRFSSGEETSVQGDLPAEVTVIFEKSASFEVPSTYKKLGYDLKGWKDGYSKGADGKDKIFPSDKQFELSEITLDIHNSGIVTLTASFEAREDTPYLVYHILKETGETIEGGMEVCNGTTDEQVHAVKIPGYKAVESPDPARKSSGTLVGVDAQGKTAFADLESVDGILKLYVYYEIFSGTYRYTIDIDKDGNPVMSDPMPIKSGESIVLEKPASDPEGKVFLGWSQNDPNGKPVHVLPEGKDVLEIPYTAGEEYAFYAQWGYEKGDSAIVGNDGDAAPNNEFVITKEKGLSGGAIAGITIGTLAGAGAVAGFIAWLVLKKRKRDRK